jgi:GSH-dependent disulfide-bond oxidoreductase
MTIDLYTYATPNGHKASIMLEETALPYTVQVVDIEKGEQMKPEFLALNPNNKIPVIVDRDSGQTVFESGAILFYLAQKSGRFLPSSPKAHIETLEWLLFQVGHVGPTMAQLTHFRVSASEMLPYAIDRFEHEVLRLFRVLDKRLAERSYLLSDYGIADIATWPWIDTYKKLNLSLDAYSNLKRWHALVAARPAVQKGLAVPQLKRKEA